MKKEIKINPNILEEDIHKALTEALSRFNTEEEGAAYLLSFALRELGFAPTVRKRQRRHLYLGDLPPSQKRFLWDFADKICRGNLQQTVFYFFDIVFNFDDGLPYDKELLKLAKIKKDFDIEALPRRASRNENSKLVLTYPAEWDKTIERFHLYCKKYEKGNGAAFTKIVETMERLSDEA